MKKQDAVVVVGTVESIRSVAIASVTIKDKIASEVRQYIANGALELGCEVFDLSKKERKSLQSPVYDAIKDGHSIPELRTYADLFKEHNNGGEELKGEDLKFAYGLHLILSAYNATAKEFSRFWKLCDALETKPEVETTVESESPEPVASEEEKADRTEDQVWETALIDIKAAVTGYVLDSGTCHDFKQGMADLFKACLAEHGVEL